MNERHDDITGPDDTAPADGEGTADDCGTVEATGMRGGTGQGAASTPGRPAGDRGTAAVTDVPGGAGDGRGAAGPVSPPDRAGQEAEGPDRSLFAQGPQLTLRGPAELADALPYMFGFHPTDSVVLLALHGERGRFGGRLRLGIPRSSREWAPVAEQLAECLVDGSERRGAKPDGIVVFLCQDPGEGETGRRVMERLRPLAQKLRTACGALDVPVYEALCISGGRFWSYCCPDSDCCPSGGRALAAPGTSVMAAAAAYAGIHLRGSLRDMESRLRPWSTGAVAEQLRALDAASAALLHRMVGAEGCERVREETIRRAGRLIRRLAELPEAPVPADADSADDRLLTHEEAAALIVGLQDRLTRDRAAEWMEGADAAPALRLWRALARRCVGAYSEHAAAPLSLAGWVAWSTGDEPTARVALGLALEADPEYVFARLLHQACNEQVDPESLRQCLRGERAARDAAGTPPGAARPGGRLPGAAARRRARARTSRVARMARAASAGGSGAPGPTGSARPGPGPSRAEPRRTAPPHAVATPAAARPSGPAGACPADSTGRAATSPPRASGRPDTGTASAAGTAPSTPPSTGTGAPVGAVAGAGAAAEAEVRSGPCGAAPGGPGKSPRPQARKGSGAGGRGDAAPGDPGRGARA
ncbi:DUF4192 family protein [Streptomyces sp. CC228A]|uniref:DUF4192 domain-containing protein n=1 Tax=Streptomyces sp. CC228A TaxID=2898186 RepID=UPI0027E48260|nr:DUF4192 family protein [Streptomyces sp. CC228A]